ncbi:MAG: hypothetical protein V4673_14480 [Pseudomonadota bacterium]
MIPTIGRIVHYALTQLDAEAITQRREGQLCTQGESIRRGNPVKEGDVFPMMITRAWGDAETSSVNGQLFMDGNDSHWLTSVSVGEGPGKFAWPQR